MSNTLAQLRHVWTEAMHEIQSLLDEYPGNPRNPAVLLRWWVNAGNALVSSLAFPLLSHFRPSNQKAWKAANRQLRDRGGQTSRRTPQAIQDCRELIAAARERLQDLLRDSPSTLSGNESEDDVFIVHAVPRGSATFTRSTSNLIPDPNLLRRIQDPPNDSSPIQHAMAAAPNLSATTCIGSRPLLEGPWSDALYHEVCNTEEKTYYVHDAQASLPPSLLLSLDH
jgi:hypothetical protein